MKNPITFSALWRQIKKLFLLWLVLSLVAALVVTGITWLSLPARSNAVAVVNLDFDGIEKGRDPNGNWFDVSTMKSGEIVTAGAELAGLTLAEGDAEKIAAHLYIQGSVPENIVGSITKMNSSYEDDTISPSSVQKITAYYPTKYTLTLNFGALGYTRNQGNALLRGILDAYRAAFFSKYGYNTALEEKLTGTDYSQYDFSNAITVLDSNLSMLDRYVLAMAAEDVSGFRSSETGLTFKDLSAGIGTVQNQDVETLSSYVIINNVSRDLDQQKREYEYQIEEAQRTLKGLEERIASLTDIINSYTKTKGVVLGTASTSTGTVTDPETETETSVSTTAAYEVNQQSAMYDSLIRQRVDLQTRMATVNAEISMYETRIANLEKGTSDDNLTYVESELNRILARVATLVENTRKTAEEYFSSHKLSSAFEVLKFEASTNFPWMRLALAALWYLVAIELVILAVFTVIVIRRARREVNPGLATAANRKKQTV